jgi:chemotaxis family two-component system sensor kinase Cph1
MTDQRTTLDNCADEPIHIPGSIQPHGVLFACRGDSLRVEQVSKNVGSFFSASTDSVLKKPLGALFNAESAETLQAANTLESFRDVNPLRLRSLDGVEVEAVLHRSADVVIVEVERGRPEQGFGFDPRLRAAVYRLQGATDVASLCRIAATEARTLTGFDRTMVYRFDDEWNGEVVAEAKREDLDSFLGHHYPASDIPAQARRLYTENWLRFIGDVSYVSVPLEPVLDPVTNAPLDLSHSTLRSVSPIHVEYMQNMGVTASVSISLVVGGKLIGLIACHHYSGPHVVPFLVRDTVQYLGQSVSWNLHVLGRADAAERERHVFEQTAELTRSLAVSDDLATSLATPTLVELAEANGAAVVMDEETRCVGTTPTREQVAAIVEWLRNGKHEVFSTSHLAAHIPAAAAWDTIVAGLVAVAVAHDLGEYVLWFRPARERTIDWAGNPYEKNVVSSGLGTRLSPRGSFALWREAVRGRALPWEPWQINAAASVRAVLLGGVRRRAAALRTLNEQLLEADRAKDTFIATVSHELRTPLNAISGWVRLMTTGNAGTELWPRGLEVIRRNTDTLSELVEDLIDVSRITAGKLTLDSQNVDLRSIADNAIDALLLSAEASGIELTRALESAVVIVGDATRIRQIVNNLLTNAIKFTLKGGRVAVRLRRLGTEAELTVTDSGEGIDAAFVPHVFDAFRQADGSMSRRAHGLGLGLAIVKKLVELHGGKVSVESEGRGKGSTFFVRIPLASVPHEIAGASSPRLLVDPSLENVRVLVVEDEDDSRDVLRVLLESCKMIVIACEDASARSRSSTASPSTSSSRMSDSRTWMALPSCARCGRVGRRRGARRRPSPSRLTHRPRIVPPRSAPASRPTCRSLQIRTRSSRSSRACSDDSGDPSSGSGERLSGRRSG